LKKISLLLSIVFFIVSCSENKYDANKQENKVDFFQNQNQQKKYQLKNTNSTQNWLQYSQLSEYIKEINNQDYSMFIDNDIYLKKFFIDLNKSLPDDLDQKEVSSRLLVIETNFWIFIEELNSLYEKKKLNRQIEKINISFSNLNFQIDNVYTKKK
tara:strand:- start:1916 stop:2383 length:468 start_codon:yes stop_codon:yes gene_type:complete